VCWVIWKVRNDHIFNDVSKTIEDLVEEIKVFFVAVVVGKV